MTSKYEATRQALEEIYAQGLELETKRANVVKHYSEAQVSLLQAAEGTWGAYENLTRKSWPRFSAKPISEIFKLIRSIPKTFDALLDFINAVDAMFDICDEAIAHQQRLHEANNAYMMSSSDEVLH